MFSKKKKQAEKRAYSYSGASLELNAKFAISESYKLARTNMLFSIASDDKHTVVFTSCSSHEGKSTTAINMAVSLAKTGLKTILIDADMRRPTINRRLKITNPKGLSDVLGGFCKIEEAISKSIYDNLDVLGTGTIPPNPSELLASRKMEENLTALQGQYDMIIIDTPPVDIVIDSQLMNKMISGIVFIIKEGSTLHPDIKRSLKKIEMAEGKVIGFIKTSCQTKEKRGYKNSSYNGYNAIPYGSTKK